MWHDNSFRIEKPSNANMIRSDLRQLESPPNEKTIKTFPDTVDFGTIVVESGPSSPRTPVPTIDNTTLVYIPIRLPCGVQVFCSPEVLSCCPMILRSLQTDLIQILKILPWSVHSLVKRTKIWVNESYEYGSRDDPRVLRHSTAHHEEGWLIYCANDRPEKAKGIEIYSCKDFERMRLHWNGCGLLLHEFTHLIHQFCLGLDDPRLTKLHDEALKSKKYEKVLRRDWAGLEEDYDMAYAMVDHKEFFAEMSVSYLSSGYQPLDKASKTVMEECSPPLLQPTVADRVLRQHNIDDPLEEPENVCWYLMHPKMTGKPKLRVVNPILQEHAFGRSCLGVQPCNKFYPFTKGQLKEFDRSLFQSMEELWHEIALWEDPEDDRDSCWSIKAFLNSVFG